MRKGRSTAARTPRKPATAEAGALLVRKFAIKLFDRDEGEAANWPLIAETLFKAAFDALDKSPDDTRRTMLLRHIHAESYERLAADPATNEAQAMTSQNEAARIDLTSPDPGAADAFRNTI
jgi:DNA-directed RNA polymerase specialized sigma24 family protein